MDDVVLGAKAGHLLAGEISSVVRDNSAGDLKAVYYVVLEELNNLLLLTSESDTASIHLVK